MSDTFDQRRAMRLVMRARRSALTVDDQDAASMAVTARLARVKAVAESMLVAGYRAVGGEVNIDGSLALLASEGVVVTVPKVVGEYLEFVPWDMKGITVKGPFGILEPVGGDPSPLLSHDIVLAPVVAFDRSGHRLGQGGGYYDRALAAREANKPVVIGIAHSFQEVEAVPIEEWDVPLDAVVTEDEVIEITPGCLDSIN